MDRLNRIYRTGSIQEAVKLAQDFKAQGKYDWFRGQIHSWPLRSSFHRLPLKEQAAAEEKLARFEEWVHTTPGLERIRDEPASLLAVAQHHGLPTDLIDFTTEPSIAGFFASQGKRPSRAESCIVCMNTDELMDAWRFVSKLYPAPRYPQPQLLTLRVPNLWRLEAQHGTFFRCPYSNFDGYVYKFGWIFFPSSGSGGCPPRELVYPVRKSPLEILLDQYFQRESVVRFRQTQAELNIERLDIQDLDDGCEAEMMSNGSVPRHQSWDSSSLEAHLNVPDELFSKASTDTEWEITLDLNRAPHLIASSVSAQVYEHLASDTHSRKELIRWTMRTPRAKLTADAHRRFLVAVSRTWDGLRMLPYSDQTLAGAIGNCAGVFAAWLGHAMAMDRETWRRSASECFGSAFEIEFGCADMSYSRGYASETALRAAIRDDLYQFLRPECQAECRDSLWSVFMAVKAPDRLFLFDALSNIFAEQVVPTQALWRDREAVPIIFSAARLTRLGLP